jgi:hypothetical protein
MKIIHKIGEITFVQTHETDGWIWAHVGQISMPLARFYDDEGNLYSFYDEVHPYREVRLAHASGATWEALDDFQQ